MSEQDVAIVAPWAESFAGESALMTADDLLRLPDSARDLELVAKLLQR